MTRCTNDTLISKIGMKTLDKLVEVDFAVLADIDSCVKVNTKNYIDYTGTSATFNTYNVPEDMFNCLAEGCKNSGTLTVTNGVGAVSGASFAVAADATEFVAGVITHYVHVPAAGTYELALTVSDIADKGQTNADVYQKTIIAAAEGFYPVVVDLSKLPEEQKGTGWSATESGIIVHIEATPEETVLSTIGFSSIYVYNSIEDFEVNDVVKIGCLDEFTGDLTVDPVEASCFGGGYDATSIAIERTLTGKSVSANYWKLNPLMSKGSQTTGWLIQTTEKTVAETVIDGVSYGSIQLPDMNMEECAFTTAAMADSCNITDALLSRVNTPVVVDINEKQFIVLEAGKILFHSSLIGKELVVSYPKKVDVEHFVGNEDSLDSRRVRMSFTQEQTDGVKQNYVYNNVLITSFPGTVNKEETTFSFTISVQRDKNGNFFEMYRVAE
ncbi:hypothetical protein IW492_01950 [Enterococcus sp. BWB1-3]|uniref:hypothetical protein n=1 Tax=unclassified Enterococcus TaxID=2608891 RepID=UPI0019236046|nr:MULTISPECIES: hypothetical protein [unclassified Enterococcus]MBL1227992.1 hypothetical protein [Enterococcus sp. BWB1-3]MCB5954029.1 hypothetical protein [Enterococcus sp. CWB-B31]